MGAQLRSFNTPVGVLKTVFKVYNAQDGVGGVDLPRYLPATYFTFDSGLWHLEIGGSIYIANSMYFVNWISTNLPSATLDAHPVSKARLMEGVTVTKALSEPLASVGCISFYCCDVYKRREYIRIYLSEQMFNKLDLIY